MIREKEIREKEITESALHKVKAQKENFGFMDRFDVEENYVVTVALEKQIPKIPDVEGDGYADGHLVYDTWICPCCGEHYEIDYDNYEYCPKCGQHIDTSNLN